MAPISPLPCQSLELQVLVRPGEGDDVPDVGHARGQNSTQYSSLPHLSRQITDL